MRMRRNWSKRLTALMLAILAFAALGTVALADETDPEKDLVIGSEYGGGGSPGLEAGPGGGENRVDLGDGIFYITPGDPLYDAIDKQWEQAFEVEGYRFGTDAVNGLLSIDRAEYYFDDGTYCMELSLINQSGKDVMLRWDIQATDEHGAVVEILDMGTYTDKTTVSRDTMRNFRIIFSKKYSKLNLDMTCFSMDDVAYPNVKLSLLPKTSGGLSFVKSIMLEDIYPSDDPIWQQSPIGVADDCSDCGITPDEDEGVVESDSFPIWILVICVFAIICVIVCVFIVRRNNKNNVKRKG